MKEQLLPTMLLKYIEFYVIILTYSGHLAYGSAFPPNRPQVTILETQETSCLGIEVSHEEGIRDIQVEKRAVGGDWMPVPLGETAGDGVDVVRRKEVQVIATKAAAGERVGEGYFRLSLQADGKTPLRVEDQVTTGFIAHDAGPQEMRDALQALSNVDEVQVRRSGPDAQGGYIWTVTFASPDDRDPFAGSNVPLLTVYMQNMVLPVPSGEMEPVVVYERHDAGNKWEAQKCLQSPCLLEICRLARSAGYQFRARVLTGADETWSPMSFPTPIARTLNVASGFTLDAPVLSSANERTIAVRVRVPMGTRAQVQYRDAEVPWYWQDAKISRDDGDVSGTDHVLAVASDLAPGNTYEFRTRTIGIKPGPWSSTSLPMKTTSLYFDELPAPEGAEVVASTIGSQSLTLRWKPVPGATGYTVQKNEVFQQDVLTYDAPEGYQLWEDVVLEQTDYVMDMPSAYVKAVSTRVDSHMTIASGGFILSTVQQGRVFRSPFLPYNADEAVFRIALEEIGIVTRSVQRNGPSSRFEYTWRVVFDETKEPAALTLYFENITRAATYSGPGEAVFIRTLQRGQQGTIDDPHALSHDVSVHNLRPNTLYQFRISARNDFDGRVSKGWSYPTSVARTLSVDLDVNDSITISPSILEEQKELSTDARLADFDLKAYSNFSSAWVEVTWHHPDSIAALLPAIAIMLERSDGVESEEFSSLPLVDDFFHPFVDVDVVPLSKYSYRVRVVSSDGVLGNPSDPERVTVPALLRRDWEQYWPQRPNVFIETELIRSANKSEQDLLASDSIEEVKQNHGSNSTEDLYQDSWKPSARFGHSLVAVGEYLYMHGGFKEGDDCSFSSDTSRMDTCRTQSGTTDETWRLHLQSKTWERVRSDSSDSGLPPSRYLHGTTVHGAKMYVFGGLLSGPHLNSAGASTPEEEISTTNGTVTRMSFSKELPSTPGLEAEAAGDLWCLSTPEQRREFEVANVSTGANTALVNFPSNGKPKCIMQLSITVTLRHPCPSQLKLSLRAPLESDLRGGPTSDVIFQPANLTCFGNGHRSQDDVYILKIATDVETSNGLTINGLSRYIGGRLGGAWLFTMVDSVQDSLSGSLLSVSMHATVVECKQSHNWIKLSDNIGPSKRYGHGALVANGALWIFGGTNREMGLLDDLWRFDFATEEWALMSSEVGLQQHLGDATVLTSHGLLRLNGMHGDLSLWQPLGLEERDETKEDLPGLRGSARMFAGLSVIDNYAVVVGGYNGVSAEDDMWILPFFRPTMNRAYCSWQESLEPFTQLQTICSIENANSTGVSDCTIPYLYSLALCESQT